MAQFALFQISRMVEGKTWPQPTGVHRGTAPRRRLFVAVASLGLAFAVGEMQPASAFDALIASPIAMPTQSAGFQRGEIKNYEKVTRLFVHF